MTKQVRVVNADTSNYKVKVFVERKDPMNGEWVRDSGFHSLDNPFDHTTLCIHDSQRLVIEESS